MHLRCGQHIYIYAYSIDIFQAKEEEEEEDNTPTDMPLSFVIALGLSFEDTITMHALRARWWRRCWGGKKKAT